ncbi:MAG: hypothetical protein H6868_05705 [Rhodospirillales bacterium]|nr:hypothetical protein [Rhodospirillales bacterium]
MTGKDISLVDIHRRAMLRNLPSEMQLRLSTMASAFVALEAPLIPDSQEDWMKSKRIIDFLWHAQRDGQIHQSHISAFVRIVDTEWEENSDDPGEQGIRETIDFENNPVGALMTLCFIRAHRHHLETSTKNTVLKL